MLDWSSSWVLRHPGPGSSTAANVLESSNDYGLISSVEESSGSQYRLGWSSRYALAGSPAGSDLQAPTHSLVDACAR